MPVAALNNVATENGYTDALTVVFAFARPRGFTVQSSNASIYYKLAYLLPGQRSPNWEAGEHFVQITGAITFRDPVTEGLPEGSSFAGVQLRSGAIDTPARVTVA